MTTSSVPAIPAEPEITSPTRLVVGNRLNPEAIGWMRQPLIDTSGVDGKRTWGRNKRWEYWNVITPTHILALTASSIDYAGVHEVWVRDRRTEKAWGVSTADILRPIEMPGSLEASPVRVRSKDLLIAIDPVPEGTRLRARIAGASFDVVAHLPKRHERLGVVVPWSETRFQYTVKDIARPATGWVETDGVREALPDGDSWATLDHGRGRWPYEIEWNWGAAAGRVEHEGALHTLGIQIGDKWTDGTGMTENSIYFDGRLTKIGPLTWEYDIVTWWRPWRIHGPQLDVVFEPFHNKQSATNMIVLSGRTDQCFGTYRGTAHVDDVGVVPFEGLVGWAEEVRNRW